MQKKFTGRQSLEWKSKVGHSGGVTYRFHAELNKPVEPNHLRVTPKEGGVT